MPTPTPTPSCIPGTTTAVDGYVTWGRNPVAGARIELRGQSPTIGAGTLVRSTTTGPDGYFILGGLDRNVSQEIDFLAQLGYSTTAVYPAAFGPELCTVLHLGPAPNSFNVKKPITGLSLPLCLGGSCQVTSTIPSAPITITWDALPTTTAYCVGALNNDTGAFAISGGDCPNNPSGGYKSVGLNRTYTMLALPSGHYQFFVIALSGDVLNSIGDATSYFTVR